MNTLQTRVKRRDNQRDKPMTVCSLLLYNRLRKEFQRRNGLREPCFTVLMYLADSYNKTGKGLTVYALANLITDVANGKNEITNTRYKIVTLLSYGLIEIGGYGGYGANTYIPTQRVIKELQAMCDEINNS